jgi:lambda family phage portal protein
LIVSSCYESGEVLVRLWDRRLEDNLAVPLQIQILEPDYLDDTKTMIVNSNGVVSGYIIQGIQFDPIGHIVGYWLYGNHPGETLQISTRGSIYSKLVPADAVLHHAEIDRPGDVRSVTRFAAVISKLRDLDEYADAEIMRKKIEACLAMMVTTPEGIDGPTLAGAAVDADGRKIETFTPGMVMYGAPGVTAEFFRPPDSANDYAAHKKTELREVAAGLEIPYVVLDDNLEAVNYSSYRGGLLAFRDAIDEYRWNWLIPQVLDPIYRKVIDKLYLMRVIIEPNYGVQWDPPPFDLLDRAAEAEADRLELQIGKKTYAQLVGEAGNDPEEQLAEITALRPKVEAAGITFAKSTSEAITQGGTQDANPQTQ